MAAVRDMMAGTTVHVFVRSCCMPSLLGSISRSLPPRC
jgi:hypothetical protein